MEFLQTDRSAKLTTRSQTVELWGSSVCPPAPLVKVSSLSASPSWLWICDPNEWTQQSNHHHKSNSIHCVSSLFSTCQTPVILRTPLSVCSVYSLLRRERQDGCLYFLTILVGETWPAFQSLVPDGGNDLWGKGGEKKKNKLDSNNAKTRWEDVTQITRTHHASWSQLQRTL